MTASNILYIGNRTYSSWSLRGWLALKLAEPELPASDVEVRLIAFDTPDWDAARADPTVLPSAMVPVLWHDGVPVWESLAIISYLADRFGADRYWPAPGKARALAMAMSAEMHAGFRALRSECPMNLRRRWQDFAVSDACRRDVTRIETLWAQARALATDEGPFLFGRFGAADAMFAPVVTRLDTYDLPVTPLSRAYMRAVLDHPWLQAWRAAARGEAAVVAHDEVEAPAAETFW